MALDPRYVVASGLDEYFVDKDTGLPLANGTLSFFRDNDRSTAKDVFTISGDPPNYSYVNIGSEITLSATGTPNYNGNNVVIYYFPYDDEGNLDLYFVECKSAEDVEQFTREAWPNSSAVIPTGQDSGQLNFIPNGQFLAHNNIPATSINSNTVGQISDAVTNIAEGGWYFNRPDASTSIDNIQFFRFGEYVPSPTASPRYALTYQCLNPNIGDAYKYIEIRFGDVNKFASSTQQFTFAFTAKTYLSANFYCILYLYKNFGTGGSPSAPITTLLTTFNLTNTYTIFQYAFTFGTNETYQVGLNNDDYVSILLAVPTNISLGLQLTDGMLLEGNVNITSFPFITNRDFMARTMVAPIPDPNGFTLGLPLIQTKDGLSYDNSQIGKIFPTVSETPKYGELLCDGSQYLSAGYSSDGIPYQRLHQEIYDPNRAVPRFGTGKNFVLCNFTPPVDTGILYIATNKPGSQTNTANGSPSTGFTFTTVFNGSAGYGFNAYNYGIEDDSDTVFIICQELGVISGNVDAGNAPVTVSVLSSQSDGSRLASGPNDTQIVNLTVTGIPTAGKYFNIANPSDQYYVWFKVNGVGVDPAPGGTGIPINLVNVTNPQDVAYQIAIALNGYQLTQIGVIAGSSIPNSSYFTFYANSQLYYVWFSLNGTGTDPALPGGIGIEVVYSSSSTTSDIKIALIVYINSVYFAVPDLRGMIIKGWDNGAGVDLNVAMRYSPGNTRIINGDGIGSYQFDNLLSHSHTVQFHPVGTTPYIDSGIHDVDVDTETVEVAETGTPQNDVKNVYLNYVIKY